MIKDIKYYTSQYVQLADFYSGRNISGSVVPVVNDIDYLLFQVHSYNSQSGFKSDFCGYVCPRCKNKKYIAVVNSRGDFALSPCPDC